MKQVTKFYCGWCGRGFRTVRKLTRHSKRLHSKLKTLVVRDGGRSCPHCGLQMPFSKFRTFVSHITTCILNKQRNAPGVYPCRTCNQSFRRRDNLKQHKRRFHSNQAVLGTPISNDDSPDDKPDFDKLCYDVISRKLDPELLVKIKNTSTKQIKQLNAKGSTTTFSFTPLFKTLSKYGYFVDVLEIVFGHLITELDLRQPDMFITMCLDSEEQLSYPIKTALMKSEEFDLALFLLSIEAVCQSRIALGMDGDLYLEVTTCKDPNVVGSNKLVASKLAHFADLLARKKGVLDPKAFQHSGLESACVAICIALALHYGTEKLKMKTLIRNKKEKKQTPNKALLHVRQFYAVLGLEYGSLIDLSVEKLTAIQNWLDRLHKIRLVVHTFNTADNREPSLFYSGSTETIPKLSINLLLYKGHCYLVTNRELAFASSHYCFDCDLPHQEGKCRKNPQCHLCHSINCFAKIGRTSARTVNCDDCSKWFKNAYCFDQHKQLGICDIEKKCQDCQRIIKAKNEFKHFCGLHWCKLCDGFFPTDDHLCYIKTLEIKPSKMGQKYIFADLESRIDPLTKVHHVVLAFAVRVCEQCIHNWGPTHTPCCGNREFYFFGEAALSDFVIWLAYTEKDKFNDGAICFCHYGGGYDFVHMLGEVLRLDHRPTKIITRNLRIISMTIGRSVRCNDSFNLFRCALRKLPKMFGLSVRKEWFPFDFLAKHPLDYVGSWPEIKDFWVKPHEKEEFAKFYEIEKIKNPIFSLKDRLIHYCKLDVYVLYHACSRFYQLLFETEKINPLNSLSISSLTATIYRARYLESSEKVALIYDSNAAAIWSNMQSKMAYRYLSYLCATNPKYKHLKFAGNSPCEMRIGDMLVDGALQKERIIIEINSCFHHAHLDPSCPYYKHGLEKMSHPLHKRMTYEDVYQKNTQFKAQYIEKKKWTLETVWTCSIEKELKINKCLGRFFKDYQDSVALSEPINARSALFGGRTGANHLYVSIDDKMLANGWRVEYFDFASLYPYVMSNNPYPTSHPEIKNHYCFKNYGENYSKAEFDSCLGLFRCRVLFDVASGVFPQFPVLPLRVNEKLVFPVCTACTNECDHEMDCNHTDAQRAMEGCWTSAELSRALDQGFRIVRIHQAWLFEESSSDLFGAYMKTYATLKYKASGFPTDVTTVKDKTEFLENLTEGMGICLTENDIQENPALRSFAKSILVNLWGKLGESCEKNGRQPYFVETIGELGKIVGDQRVDVTDMKLITDKHLLVETKTKQEFYEPNRFHNPVISSFVTAYGRLYLLDALERLGNLVLYYDTDSCIFLYQDGGVGHNLKPKTGELFGDFKSELQPDEIGTKFLSLAPKMYALLTTKDRLIFRAKGLSLDEKLSKHLNFELFTAILLQNSEHIKKFYDQLEDKALGRRLKEEHIRRIECAGGDEKKVGIVLPDPLITRNWKKKEKIRNDDSRTKNLRLTFSKRRICSQTQCLQYTPILMTSHPWGFQHHHPSPSSPTLP